MAADSRADLALIFHRVGYCLEDIRKQNKTEGHISFFFFLKARKRSMFNKCLIEWFAGNSWKKDMSSNFIQPVHLGSYLEILEVTQLKLLKRVIGNRLWVYWENGGSVTAGKFHLTNWSDISTLSRPPLFREDLPCLPELQKGPSGFFSPVLLLLMAERLTTGAGCQSRSEHLSWGAAEVTGSISGRHTGRGASFSRTSVCSPASGSQDCKDAALGLLIVPRTQTVFSHKRCHTQRIVQAIFIWEDECVHIQA